MKIKTLLVAFLIYLVPVFASASLSKIQRIVGTFAGTSPGYVLLKTPTNTLLIPKDLISKKSFVANEVIQLSVTKEKMDRIKIKK